jgi:hypothetical protein
MANIDNPRGLWPTRHLTGGEITTREFTVTTGATIYRGDIVEMVSGGTVDPAAATDGVKIVGVAAHYVSDAASAGGKVLQVYVDPYIAFGIQVVTGQTPSAAWIGLSADPDTYAAGSTTTYVSSTELAAASAQTALFHVIGKIDSPDNAWGEHADVEVVFNEHRYKASAGSAGI